MWLGAVPAPSARSRLAETVAAAKSSALDGLYGRVFPRAALGRLKSAKIGAHKTRNIFQQTAQIRPTRPRGVCYQGMDSLDRICELISPLISHSEDQTLRHHTRCSGIYLCL